jgi:hypothetical protein
MESEKTSPIDRDGVPPGQGESRERVGGGGGLDFIPDGSPDNRRTRLAGRKDRGGGPDLPAKVHDWLIRTTRVHAHLCYVVRCFAKPAGNEPGDTVEARAARRDRTLLHDCWAYAMGELASLQDELEAEMEPAEAVKHRPGSPEKIATMAERAARLESIFAPGDADLDSGPYVR